MLPGDAGQSADGVGIDADEASGRADAAALVEVLKHGEGLLLGEMAVEQGRALALGEAVLAGLAVEQSDVVLLCRSGADREIAGVAAGVEGAVGVLAAEVREVIPAGDRSEPRGSDEFRGYEPDVAPILRCSPAHGSIILSHDLKSPGIVCSHTQSINSQHNWVWLRNGSFNAAQTSSLRKRRNSSG